MFPAALTREMSMRTDGRKERSIDVDRTGPAERIRIAGTRLEHPDNLKDENEYVARFAQALTNVTGRRFVAIPKLEEDSDFPDIYLQVEKETVGVQITHFDRVAVEAIYGRGQYSTEMTVKGIAAAAVDAMAAKQGVEPALTAKTYLLLICPYPIRAALHEEIRAEVKAAGTKKTYLETWVASLNEPPFRVQ
jgi:hypothetical protein